MLNDLIALRNKLQPTGASNHDPIIFDYSFWTKLESISKKEREKALDRVKKIAKSDVENGVILRGSKQQIILETAKAAVSFDKDIFIEEVAKQFKIDKHKLRELSATTTKTASPRRTYKAEDIEVE